MDNNNIFELKTSDSYGYDKRMYNFVCADEYTVTITLAEYRELTEKSGVIDYINKKIYELQSECDALKKELEKAAEK